MRRFSIGNFIPVFDWFPTFLRNNPGRYIGGDVVAGLTVGVLIMPQAIAYAQLAGLPPVQGLYSSLVPMFVYFFFGTSRQLSVGPVSMVSLSIASALQGNSDIKTDDEKVKYAVIINFFVGIVYIIMGLVHLGRIIDYIQTPIISGFTSAAAVIVIAGQISSFFGIQIVNPSSNTFVLLIQSIEAIKTIRILPCVMAMFSLLANFFIVKRFPSLPSSLIITVSTALITFIVCTLTKSESCGGVMFYFFETVGGTLIPETTAAANITAHMTKNKFKALSTDQLEKYAQLYLPVIGEIKPGLPEFKIPQPFSRSESPLVGAWLATPVILVILLGFMESISISKKYAEILNYPLNSNQELIALGLANLAGSFFSCYSVAGSFSRTAVNAKSGARTPIASLITASLIALFLYGFTFLLYYVPKCTLAVILILAVYGLIDFKLLNSYIKHKKFLELILFFAVFLATCCFGTTYGLIVGTVFNIIHIIIKKRRGESITEEGEKQEPKVQSAELMNSPDEGEEEEYEDDLTDDSINEQKFRLIEKGPVSSKANRNEGETREIQKL
jgi:high affinity sulfate transporter 1